MDNRINTQFTALNDSLDELEAHLDPLFAQPFSECLSSLEKLQQAKAQTVIPYVLYDLVFMYLKTKGIDPKSHPIISELSRIKEYFDKISNAEKQLAPKEDSRMAVDQEVAARFIKHAIAQAQAPKRTSSPEPSTSTFVPVKLTEKMIERQAYQEELKKVDEQGEEEDDLKIIDDTSMTVDENPASKKKRKNQDPGTKKSKSNKKTKKTQRKGEAKNPQEYTRDEVY